MANTTNTADPKPVFPPGNWSRFWRIVFREIDRIDAEDAKAARDKTDQ